MIVIPIKQTLDITHNKALQRTGKRGHFAIATCPHLPAAELNRYVWKKGK